MPERLDLPGWLWPLVALVIFGLSCEILFETVYQARNRELERLARQTDDLKTKVQEGQAARKSLDQFHGEARQLDSELAKLDHIVPQTADLAADAEDRWLREAFTAAGFTVRKKFLGELQDGELVTSRRTPFNITTPTTPENLDELLHVLERRLPAHGLTALTETRHPGGESTYRIEVEVSAAKQAPAGR